jgi:hypothetical protein
VKFTGTALAFGLFSVNVAWVVPPTGTATAAKLLVRLMGSTTVRVAVAVFPVPATASDTVTLLTKTPVVVGRMFTLNVQLVFGFRVALNPIVEPPLLTTTTAVDAPLQVPVTPDGFAMTRPAGSVSVNATPVSVVVALGLDTVKVTAVVPVARIAGGANAFVTIAADGVTLSVAVAALPLPALDATRLVVFTYMPGVEEVALMVIVQVVPAASDGIVTPMLVPAPARLMAEPIGQADEKVTLAKTPNRPDGSGSVKLIFVSAVAAFGFVTEKLIVEVPPETICGGLNALIVVGGV